MEECRSLAWLYRAIRYSIAAKAPASAAVNSFVNTSRLLARRPSRKSRRPGRQGLCRQHVRLTCTTIRATIQAMSSELIQCAHADRIRGRCPNELPPHLMVVLVKEGQGLCPPCQLAMMIKGDNHRGFQNPVNERIYQAALEHLRRAATVAESLVTATPPEPATRAQRRSRVKSPVTVRESPAVNNAGRAESGKP